MSRVGGHVMKIENPTNPNRPPTELGVLPSSSAPSGLVLVPVCPRSAPWTHLKVSTDSSSSLRRLVWFHKHGEIRTLTKGDGLGGERGEHGEGVREKLVC